MKMTRDSNNCKALGWRYHIEMSKAAIAFCLWLPLKFRHPSKPLIYLWIK